MDSLNFLIIGSAIAIVLLLWIVMGIRHLKALQRRVENYWEEVDVLLRKRQDLVPNLVETIRKYEEASSIPALIEARIKAAKEYYPGRTKIEYEHDLSGQINKLIELVDGNLELRKDTNFMELRREIDELEDKMEIRVEKYNKRVRSYNRNRGFFFLAPLAAVMRYKKADIFEVEK